MSTAVEHRPSVWQRLGQALRGYWIAPLSASSPELARLWQATPVTSGVSVNERTALTYSAVWAAVALISGDVGSLPLILYRRLRDGGKERFTDHPLYRILHDEPNPEMASMTFREVLTSHLLTWGNAYAEIERDVAGRVKALWPITPDRVVPLRDGARLRYRVSNPGRADVFFAPEDVLHIPGLGFDGILGYSVIAQARESLGVGLAAEKFGAAFFGNGAAFGGVLTHPAKLSELALKNLRESIQARHSGGPEKAHRFLMLEEGMTYTSIGIPPDDAQFIESREFQIEEVARWFQVPPHKIGHLKRATFSNIEHQDLDYYRTSLRRWLIRWEQEINRKLVAPSERRIQFAEHNADAILRGDIKTRYEAYAIGRQNGWLSANEIRERENFNPLPEGGDLYLVPLNMLPADRVNEKIDHDLTNTPAPAPPAPEEAEDAEDEARGELALAHETIAHVRHDLVEAQQVAEQGRQALEAARTEAARLQALREAEAAALEAAARREEALAARLDAIEQQLARREADAQQAAQDRQRRDAAVYAHHRALLISTFARVRQIEIDRARRSLGRGDLGRWLESFYLRHGEVVVEQLLPIVQAVLVWAGDGREARAVTEAAVAADLARSRRELQHAADDPDREAAVARTLAGWESTRAEAAADALLHEVMHARA